MEKKDREGNDLNSGTGIKYDAGKPMLSLLTKESLIAETRALEYGAKKYSRSNYKKGMDWTRLIDSALRHMVAFNDGEDNDSESGINHLAHAKACLAMLIYYYENNVGTDDRDKPIDKINKKDETNKQTRKKRK